MNTITNLSQRLTAEITSIKNGLSYDVAVRSSRSSRRFFMCPIFSSSIERAQISLTHREKRWLIGVAGRVGVRASQRTPASGHIVCGIPGANPDAEYTADIMQVTDDPFNWDLSGRASFVAGFSYSGSTLSAAGVH